MAKNFGNAGSNKAFESVGKKAAERAQIITMQNIATDNLIDNPENGEDISYTEDLELSMRENGFTDPLEVTDFGMESGKYMILSGHRRRAAGIKVGITLFPCVVRHFENESSLVNYTLLSNNQRDSARDPFLFCKRYKMHENYLTSINYKGNIREEVARRLGLSVQQADRYNTMNRIILPVWDMIRAEMVGMSSVQPMASHNEDEQTEIHKIMQEALVHGVSLTRDTMKKLIDEYRKGKKTWAEIADLPRDSGQPLNGFMNTEPGETIEPLDKNRNDEIRREPDPIAADADKTDSDRERWEQSQEEQEEEPGDSTGEDEEDGEKKKKEKKPQMTTEEMQIKRSDDIMKLLHKLDSNLAEIYKCENKDAGLEMLEAMGNIANVLIDEMYNLSEEFDLQESFENKTKMVASNIGNY